MLGKVRNAASARPTLLGGWLMAAAATVFAGVSAHGSGAAVAPAGRAEVPGPPAPVAVAAPPVTPEPPATTATTEPPPATTTTEPASTTTTTAPPPTATTTAPATTAPAIAAPAGRVAAGPSRQEQIEAIADATGWDWRAAGIRLTVGFFPEDCCHWGVYESARHTVWIGPTAFAHPTRLRYVVLHELAHGWQYTRNRFDELIADYRPWGRTTPAEALEAGGDCIATLWGATDHHYWDCPAAALRLAARRLAGDWS